MIIRKRVNKENILQYFGDIGNIRYKIHKIWKEYLSV